jgi:hypothetical protein
VCRKRAARKPQPAAGDGGQATLEWVGVVFLVAALIAVSGYLGAAAPVAKFAHGLTRSLLCAASLQGGCGVDPALEDAYGPDVAKLVRRYLPRVLFGADLLGMPVDYRTCRSPACADPPPSPLVTGSTAGEPPTLFTRVIDCRAGRAAPPVRCDGIRQGNLYFQYWAYYPESASLRGVPVLEEQGYHAHDWEVLQVRIQPGGRVSQRASSHRGFNHTRSVANWPSDSGLALPPGLSRKIGRPDPKGWGPWFGGWQVAGGSHAGNVSAPALPTRGGRLLAGHRTRLVPIESVRSDALSRPARFDPVTPPWLKQGWSDPETAGTG